MKKMGLGIAGLAGMILGGGIVEIVEKKNKKSKNKSIDQNTKRLKSYYDILPLHQLAFNETKRGKSGGIFFRLWL